MWHLGGSHKSDLYGWGKSLVHFLPQQFSSITMSASFPYGPGLGNAISLWPELQNCWLAPCFPCQWRHVPLLHTVKRGYLSAPTLGGAQLSTCVLKSLMISIQHLSRSVWGPFASYVLIPLHPARSYSPHCTGFPLHVPFSAPKQ